jgi:hypothetical protein
MIIFKRIKYILTRFKHDCAETIQDYPQPIYADDKVFVRCPICKKRYRIQFASMIKQIIKQILTPPKKVPKQPGGIKEGRVKKGGRNNHKPITPRPEPPKKQK